MFLLEQRVLTGIIDVIDIVDVGLCEFQTSNQTDSQCGSIFLQEDKCVESRCSDVLNDARVLWATGGEMVCVVCRRSRSSREWTMPDGPILESNRSCQSIYRENQSFRTDRGTSSVTITSS